MSPWAIRWTALMHDNASGDEGVDVERLQDLARRSRSHGWGLSTRLLCGLGPCISSARNKISRADERLRDRTLRGVCPPRSQARLCP